MSTHLGLTFAHIRMKRIGREGTSTREDTAIGLSYSVAECSAAHTDFCQEKSGHCPVLSICESMKQGDSSKQKKRVEKWKSLEEWKVVYSTKPKALSTTLSHECHRWTVNQLVNLIKVKQRNSAHTQLGFCVPSLAKQKKRKVPTCSKNNRKGSRTRHTTAQDVFYVLRKVDK